MIKDINEEIKKELEEVDFKVEIFKSNHAKPPVIRLTHNDFDFEQMWKGQFMNYHKEKPSKSAYLQQLALL